MSNTTQKTNAIPLMGELESAVTGGFVTDILQVRGGSQTINNVTLSSDGARILFLHGNNQIAAIESNKIIATGILKRVELKNDNSVLGMTFVINNAEQTVDVPLSQIFSPNNYYTKEDVDHLFEQKQLSFYAFDKYIANSIPDEKVITGQSAPEDITDRFRTCVVYLVNKGKFALEVDDGTGNYSYYTTWDEYNKYNNGSSIHSDRFYTCEGYAYFNDGGTLQKLSMYKFLDSANTAMNNALYNFQNTDISPIQKRLAALEDKTFPMEVTVSSNPQSNRYDGAANNAKFTLTFKKNGEALIPDRITVEKTAGGSTTTIYQNDAPDSYTVSFTDSNINTTSTTYKITIEKDGVTKVLKTHTYKLIPPMFIGFAPKDETFENLIKNLNCTYTEKFTAITSITCNNAGERIYILIPSSKKLDKFTYGTLNLHETFQEISLNNNTLNNITYKVYMNDTDGIKKGMTFDNLTITLS